MKTYKITHCGKDYIVKAKDAADAVNKIKSRRIADESIKDAEEYVIFKENGDIKGTLLSNYNARIRNANQVTNFSKQGFKSTKEAKEYMEKYGKGSKVVIKDEISKSINDIKPDYVDGDWELIAQGGSGSIIKGIFYKGKYIKSVRGTREAKAELNALKQGKNDPAFEKVKRSLSEQSKSKSSWKLRRVLHRNIPREANLAEREGIVWGVSARNEAYEYVDEHGFLHVLPKKL